MGCRKVEPEITEEKAAEGETPAAEETAEPAPAEDVEPEEPKKVNRYALSLCLEPD